VNAAAVHRETPGGPGFGALSQRFREAGLLLVECDQHGEVGPGCTLAGDWLTELLLRSPLFRVGLRRAAEGWAKQAEPVPVEAMPGCWLAPSPKVSRRRLSGYGVTVILTSACESSEQFAAMCQASGADFELHRRRLRELPPAATCDVPRLAQLSRLAHQEQASRTSDRRAMESVGQQLAESYEEINLLYTIIQNMTVVQQPQRFVSMACHELLATLPYRWIAAQMAEDHEHLKALAGRLIVAGEPGVPESVLKELAAKLLSECDGESPSVLTPASSPALNKFTPLGQSIAVQPVGREGRIIGALIAGDKRGPDPEVSSADIKLLGATATHMGIFMENAALYDDLHAMFLGTLEAITASIDAKDRYTCGHSQRVALLTQQLGRAHGLDEQAVSRLHIAGLVHDVGKIGVPESVLSKPGKLTESEFAWIRRHPEIGHRILKDIPQLKDVLPGVLHHHERWDGRGYPAGLQGEEIPFVARLIALADTFDAMSSSRAYRAALSRPEVLAEIRSHAGRQFDPELAEQFLTLDFSEFDRMVAEHNEASRCLQPEMGEAA
jgi:HD-GYP domain-containing protein (c-di-GMP phosphodiesterase class II)